MAPPGAARGSSVDDASFSRITCKPLTSSCLTDMQGGKRFKYYHALQLERLVEPDIVVRHKVLLGELVVYLTPDGCKLESIPGYAQVGRVVTLFEAKDSAAAATDYSLVVRPLYAWSQVYPTKAQKAQSSHHSQIPRLSDEDAKQIRQNVRHKNALFESTQVETISCQQVVLGRTIRLLPPGDAATESDVEAEQFVLLDIPNRQKKAKKSKSVDHWVLRYTCRHRVEPNGGICPIEHGRDIDYEAVRVTDTIPVLIQREMRFLNNQRLAQAMLATYCSQLKKFIVEERCSAQLVKAETDLDTRETSLATSKTAHAPSKSSGKKRKAAKAALLSDDCKITKSRGRKTASAQVTESCTAKAESKDSLDQNQPRKVKPSKRGTNVNGDDGKKSYGALESSTSKTAVSPLSESVYTFPGSARGDPCKPIIQFYTHVQLSIDRNALYAPLRAEAASHWIVAVGDVIAACCINSRASHTSDKSTRWYPFSQPWSPAQILSIYRVGPNDGGNINDGKFMMELRWFYRPYELEPNLKANLPSVVHRKLFGDTTEAKRMIIEVDEHVNEVPIESALGRVIASSDNSSTEGWERFLADDGVPQIHITIQYKYFTQLDDGILHETTDWNDYTKTFQGPLNDILTCGKAYPGRKEFRSLRRSYKTFLIDKYNISGSIRDAKVTEQNIPDDLIHNETVHMKFYKEWPKSLIESSTVTQMIESGRAKIIYSEDLGRGKTREYLESIHVPVLKKCCDPRVTASKASISKQYWKIRIGDFVCVMDNEALPDSDSLSKGRNPWYPFLGPWSVGQLLSINHQVSRNTTTSGPFLEIRKFVRKSDLPAYLYPCMPPRTDFNSHFCFETNQVLTDVPVSRILGRVDLFLGQFAEYASTKKEFDHGIPSQSCRCCFSYDDASGRFQPVFSASKTPAGWLAMITCRGILASNMMRQRTELRKKTLSYMEKSSNAFDLDSMLTDHETEDFPLLPLKLPSKKLDVSYYLAAPVKPRWEDYKNSELICPLSDRACLAWRARVGDIVAVRIRDELALPEEDQLPFTVPWKIGQILSIYRQTEEQILTEIRWLQRRRREPDCELGSMEFLSESEMIEKDVVPLAELLGPVLVLGGNVQRDPWSSIYPFLPVAPAMHEGSKFTSDNESSRDHQPLDTIIRRGLERSSHYTEEDVRLILSKLDDLTAADDLEHMSLLSKARTSSGNLQGRNEKLAGSPAHDVSSQLISSVQVNSAACFTDKASGIECFDSLMATVPKELTLLDVWEESDATFQAKVGDVVILQYDIKRKVKLSHCEPFNVPWGIGEIVTIFRRIDLNIEDIRLEIRWFYRFEEIPGLVYRGIDRCDSVLDEVLETDDYEEVSASRLLAAAKLIESPTVRDETLSRSQFLFICQRFWSVKNKSIVPTGGLGGRIHRGQRLSKIITRLHALPPQSVDDRDRIVNMNDETQPVVRAFERVIEKMSLTDASKVSHTDEGGLVGRGKERECIANFLRNAIIGRIDDKRPSIFIAGPPGVGKTACVRAVIGKLQQEQTAGKVPPFQFYTINGMEMRHPLELYAQLWELVTGDRIAVEVQRAHQRLDNFFGRPGGDASTIVLLVDEIDYLVTKDQSVIYSLFDWPARSAEISCPRRLILIGISNTLNLPEQMHPRVQSRLGTHRCSFRAYGVAEAAEILHAKIKHASPHYEVFTPDCINYAAKKTASMSGDIRKALTLCRIAAESVLDEIENGTVLDEKPQVKLKQMFRVTGSSFNSPESHRIAGLSDFEALVIIAIAALTRNTGREQGGFDLEEVMTKMEAMANALGDVRYVPTPCLSETLEIVSRLSTSQLISLHTPRNASISYRTAMAGSGGAWPLVALLVDDNLLYMALKDSRHSALVNTHLKH